MPIKDGWRDASFMLQSRFPALICNKLAGETGMHMYFPHKKNFLH